MSLFRKAGERFVGGKFYAFGEEGSGKSKFTTTFPKSAIIDTEAGTYEDEPNVVFVANTTSHKEVAEAIDEIHENLLEEIDTLVVDSETKIYDSMTVSAMEVEEKRAKEKGGDIDDANVSMRGWGKIKNVTKKLQAMKIDLSSSGKFVVSTAQKSDVTKQIGNERVKVGEKAEAHKSLPYDYDVVLRFFTQKKKINGKEQATYHAEVLKDRTETFQKYDVIDNPHFDLWKPYYDKKRKTGKIVETHYVEDAQKDIDAFEEEDKLIDEAKSKMTEVVKILGKEKGTEKLKEIMVKAGIKSPKAINDSLIAEKVIKLTEEVLNKQES